MALEQINSGALHRTTITVHSKYYVATRAILVGQITSHLSALAQAPHDRHRGGMDWFPRNRCSRTQVVHSGALADLRRARDRLWSLRSISRVRGVGQRARGSTVMSEAAASALRSGRTDSRCSQEWQPRGPSGQFANRKRRGVR